VGSAYVKRMKAHLSDGPESLAQIVETYTREMLSAANR
jgi:hypothetical protein